MKYRRMYYYDEEAQAGRYPLDEQLQIGGQVSAGLERQLVRLSAVLPYEPAVRIMAELARVQVSDTTAWRRVQQAGERVRELSSESVAVTSPSASEIGQQQLGATMDGAMVNVRGEGWKETKIGCIFEVIAQPLTTQTGLAARLNTAGEPVEAIKAQQQTYLFHLGGPEALGVKLDAEATARAWSRATNTSVTADGAEWIWNLSQRYFSSSAHIVDWYHAKTHLWNAAHALSATDQAAAAWLHQYSDWLYHGQANALAEQLDLAACNLSAPEALKVLHTEAGYFRTHHERMQYQDFQAAGVPIGSGTVESGAKQFKARFCQTGMRWSRAGLQNALPFRAALMSQRFDALWNAACPC